MFRLLRLKGVLIQTVHSPEVGKLDLNARAKAVIRDIKTPQFFCAIYVVCSVVYPNLKLLRFCDKLTPVMDVLHHLTLRTPAALEQQRDKLVEPELFDIGAEGDIRQEAEEMFGPKSAVQPVAAVDEVRV